MFITVATKKIIFLVVLCAVTNNSYCMEGDPLTETTYLLGSKERSLSLGSLFQNNLFNLFHRNCDTPGSPSAAMLPPEVWEIVFDYLPGNDSGLNYVIRDNNFPLSDRTAAKVQEAFLQYLAKNYVKQEQFGNQIIHFFEHHRTAEDTLALFSDDIRDLNELMPDHAGHVVRCNDWVDNTDNLDVGKIKKALKEFRQKTLTKWDNLDNNTKEVISFSTFCKIRAEVLGYFKYRLREKYQGEANCSYAYLPGCFCCLLGISSLAVGIPVACVFDEIAGTALAAAGGVGGFGCGCMGLFGVTPIYNDCKREFINTKEKTNPHRNKLEEIIELLDATKVKINPDAYDDEYDENEVFE